MHLNIYLLALLAPTALCRPTTNENNVVKREVSSASNINGKCTVTGNGQCGDAATSSGFAGSGFFKNMFSGGKKAAGEKPAVGGAAGTGVVPAEGKPAGVSGGDSAGGSNSQFSSATNVDGKCETVGDTSCGGDGQGATGSSNAGGNQEGKEVVPAQ